MTSLPATASWIAHELSTWTGWMMDALFEQVASAIPVPMA
jgi:hypothetical protein